MALQDLVGWIAASLVLATFSARSMVPLRALAVGSNVAFVGYAYMAGLWPILLLHSIMLPLNAQRLRQAIVGRTADAPDADAARPEHRFAVIAANDNLEHGHGETATALAMT
jgi:hypothetical protein